MISPAYKLSDRMVSQLAVIAEAKAIIDRARLLPQQELRLRRQALVRMTQSSTGIEGNLLNQSQVAALAAHKKIDAPERDVYEVQNYMAAIDYISRVVKKQRQITERMILNLHRLVTLQTLAEEKSGKYRTGNVYVVRRYISRPQKVVYAGPEARRVRGLMRDLVRWIATSQEQNIHPIVVAGLVHQEIALIHPFSDGNGRTARALATLVLYQRGYDFRRLFALEDYYNKDRASYYAAISAGKTYDKRDTDATPWLEYFIRGFKEEIDRVKAQIFSLGKRNVSNETVAQIFLTKEQLAILDFLDQNGKVTIKDAVRFLKCPKRTAQLCLQKLKKLKLIKTVGKGPSSAYVSD